MSVRAGLLVFLLPAGCSRFSPPEETELRAIDGRPRPPGPFVRVRASVDIDGRWLSGTFEAALVARSGEDPAARLQLFPDLGGKALDLAVRRDRVTGYFPHTGEGIDWALPGEARAHPLLFLGLTLLERFAPVTRERVLGVRREAGSPPRFLLRPVVEGVRVVDGGGRRFRWGPWADWTERGDPLRESVLEAPGLRIRVRTLEVRAVEAVDPALFALTLPGGTGPR